VIDDRGHDEVLDSDARLVDEEYGSQWPIRLCIEDGDDPPTMNPDEAKLYKNCTPIESFENVINEMVNVVIFTASSMFDSENDTKTSIFAEDPRGQGVTIVFQWNDKQCPGFRKLAPNQFYKITAGTVHFYQPSKRAKLQLKLGPESRITSLADVPFMKLYYRLKPLDQLIKSNEEDFVDFSGNVTNVLQNQGAVRMFIGNDLCITFWRSEEQTDIYERAIELKNKNIIVRRGFCNGISSFNNAYEITKSFVALKTVKDK
jgi:hypothetical protein